MNASPETLLCGCTSGTIFVRPCVQPAITQCARCQCPLCREHARLDSASLPVPPLVSALCPACAAESGQFGDDDGDATWSVGSSRHSRSGWNGSSGNYGAGYATTSADTPFASEDYDAFDAVSDYDKDAEQGDGYDS